MHTQKNRPNVQKICNIAATWTALGCGSINANIQNICRAYAVISKYAKKKKKVVICTKYHDA